MSIADDKIIMAGEFKMIPLYYMFLFPLWSIAAMYTAYWAYTAEGVVPAKYLKETGLALGLKWGMFTGVVGMIQVISVVMYRTFAFRPNPLTSKHCGFIAVGNKALNNWVQQSVLFVLNLIAFSFHARGETVALFAIVNAVSRLVYWVGYVQEAYTGIIGRTPVAFGMFLSLIMMAKNAMWILGNN